MQSVTLKAHETSMYAAVLATSFARKARTGEPHSDFDLFVWTLHALHAVANSSAGKRT